jgi:hypothetical protein
LAGAPRNEVEVADVRDPSALGEVLADVTATQLTVHMGATKV